VALDRERLARARALDPAITMRGMPQWLDPGRYADRLLAAAFDVSDEIRGPSAFANGTIFTFLDDALDAEEGMTENARDVAMYLVRPDISCGWSRRRSAPCGPSIQASRSDWNMRVWSLQSGAKRSSVPPWTSQAARWSVTT
jgi:hypothetical protein